MTYHLCLDGVDDRIEHGRHKEVESRHEDMDIMEQASTKAMHNGHPHHAHIEDEQVSVWDRHVFSVLLPSSWEAMVSTDRKIST